MPSSTESLWARAATAVDETPQFPTAMRGYERRQVDEHLATLLSACRATQSRVHALEAQVEDYEGADPTVPTFAAAGSRVEKILRLAEEEAREVRAEAEATAQQHRAQAADEVAQILEQGEKDALSRKQQSELKCAQILGVGKAEAERVKTTAANEAAAKMASAEQLIEEARAEASQIAIDVTSKICERREQAERAMTARQEVAEERLAETAQKAAEIRAEAQRLRDDAEARAKALLEATRRDAEQLVNDARMKAEGARLEAERELAALTHRRDSINTQLADAREMLASLTGSAASLADRMESASPSSAQPAGVSAAAVAWRSAKAREKNGKLADA